jgi:predicted ATPase
VEAVSHLTKGLELLKTLPDIPERSQQELALQTALGPVLIATKGYTAPEVEHAYTRALELCRQIGETPQLFPVLRGLQIFYLVRAEHKTARELGEQLLTLAQRVQDPVFLSGAHSVLGQTLYFLGELASAREHLEQGIALYGLQQYRSLAWAGAHPGAQCLGYTAWTLWHLGYPEQALKRNHEVLALAQELSHPFSLAYALASAAWLHQYRREGQSSQERAEAIIALSVEQGFPFWSALGTIVRGWALAEQGQAEEGIGQMRQGLAALRVTGAEMFRPWFLTLLAEAYGKEGQTEEGLNALAEALVQVDKTGERYWEAELYRLKGELTLQKFKVQGSKFKVANPQSLTPSTQHLAPNTQAEAEAEACFHKAIEVARKQQAKSLELRATMSLVRLRQQQATQHVSRTTQHEARAMLDAARNTLSEIYNWFTEGFDTKDLQEAKALLEELSH